MLVLRPTVYFMILYAKLAPSIFSKADIFFVGVDFLSQISKILLLIRVKLFAANYVACEAHEKRMTRVRDMGVPVSTGSPVRVRVGRRTPR